jgi:hypothetical protein
MKLTQQKRKNYANEQTEQGIRQWLIIAALLAAIGLVILGIRLIFH